MPSVPNACTTCGGQLFLPVWGVRQQDETQPLEDGNKSMRRDGFMCVRCFTEDNVEEIQVTRDIPGNHFDNFGLVSPNANVSDHR